jgi:hypothetical protein
MTSTTSPRSDWSMPGARALPSTPSMHPRSSGPCMGSTPTSPSARTRTATASPVARTRFPTRPIRGARGLPTSASAWTAPASATSATWSTGALISASTTCARSRGAVTISRWDPPLPPSHCRVTRPCWTRSTSTPLTRCARICRCAWATGTRNTVRRIGRWMASTPISWRT